mmetsp:Transcript_2508/g.3062  ORF Transcript_2508/g.3062 Transcript_2508/m.3062 type:complete len:133 (+) Transcript_2508:1449-1847(+)
MVNMLVFCKKNSKYFPTAEQVEKEYWKRRAARKANRGSSSSGAAQPIDEDSPIEGSEEENFQLPVPDPADESISQLDVDFLIDQIAESRVGGDTNAFEDYIQELENQELVNFFDFPDPEPDELLGSTMRDEQ